MHLYILFLKEDQTAASDTPLESFYEANDPITHERQINSTRDATCISAHVEESTSYPCYDTYDDLGVGASKYDEDVAGDELPLEADVISQEEDREEGEK